MLDIPEAAWAALGAAVTGIGMLAAGWLKSKTDVQLGMTTEQRLMLESVFAQVQLQSTTIDSLHKDITSQREYYEAKIDELRVGYRQEIADQEVNCHAQLEHMRKEIERLKGLMC